MMYTWICTGCGILLHRSIPICPLCLEKGPERSTEMKVAMINKNLGEVMKTFDSVDEACFYTDMSKTYLLNCLEGREPEAGGFLWRYVEDSE